MELQARIMNNTDHDAIEFLKGGLQAKGFRDFTKHYQIGNKHIFDSPAFLRLVRHSLDVVGIKKHRAELGVRKNIFILHQLSSLGIDPSLFQEYLDNYVNRKKLREDSTKAIRKLQEAAELMGLRKDFFFVEAEPDDYETHHVKDGRRIISKVDGEYKIIDQNIEFMASEYGYREPPDMYGETSEERNLRRRANLWALDPIPAMPDSMWYENRKQRGPKLDAERAAVNIAVNELWKHCVPTEWKKYPVKYSPFVTIAKLITDFLSLEVSDKQVRTILFPQKKK